MANQVPLVRLRDKTNNKTKKQKQTLFTTTTIHKIKTALQRTQNN